MGSRKVPAVLAKPLEGSGLLSSGLQRHGCAAIAMIEPGAASPGIALARSLRLQQGLLDRVVGLAWERDASRLRSADLGLASVVGTSIDDDAHFLSALQEVRDRWGVQVLLGARSADVAAISRLDSEIAHLGIRTFGPTRAQREMLSTGGGETRAPRRVDVSYAVAAVGDGRGGVAGVAALRKVVPQRGSQRWVGVAAQDEGLLAMVRAFFSACSLRGPAELDVGRDEEGYHVLRVEPRLPAWVQLFASYGPNLPAVLVKLAQGEPVAHPAELPGGPLLVGAAWEAWMTPA
jgi:hypothetical protein